MDWEFGISRCKVLYIERINIKVLLYDMGDYIQYPVIIRNGKEYEEGCIYICIYICIYMHIYICITESLCYRVEINTTL